MKKAGGFSMFELLVYIISVSIIYVTAANRFSEFPAAAERANFLAISAQLRSGVNLELMGALTKGDMARIGSFENSNPMALMLEAPNNYLGEFDSVNRERVQRRSWYFDTQSRELVYLVNASEGVYLQTGAGMIPSNEIRFRLEVVYRDDYRNSLPGSSGQRPRILSGMLLTPVVPYQWYLDDSQLLDIALADTEI
ncbi:MAG: hypothetical protein HQ498_13955 [Pseudohongiella sp.]|nr:hypothetical protein [Pseudohongiella sp.]